MAKPFTKHYYHGGFRKTTIAFGALFSELSIVKIKDPEFIGRTRKDNKEVIEEFEERIVPIEYAPKEKYETLLSERENVKDIPNNALPRMAYEVIDIRYDPTRKQTALFEYDNQIEDPDNEIQETVDKYVYYPPIPYILDFELSVFGRGDDDSWQILEQILPLFQPEYTLSVLLNDDTKERRDISFVYQGMSKTDDWKENFEERRYVLYLLSFQARTYLYSNIALSKGVTGVNLSVKTLNNKL